MDELNLNEITDELNQAAMASQALPTEEVPTLVFGEPAVEEEKPAPQPAPKPQTAVIDDSILSEAEKKQVAAFSKQINLNDTASILNYGAGVQTKMSQFSDTQLDAVRTRDLGEVGDLLAGVVTDLKEFNPDEDEKDKGIFGFFKKKGRDVGELKQKYDKVNGNVNQVADALKKHQVKLMKDVTMLDKMYAQNLLYYKELTMYILAGKRRMVDFENNELAQARAKAQASNLPEDAQVARDLEDQLTRFERKIHDLELTRMIAIQTAPQIRLIQNSDNMMVEKIQSTLTNTIPLWKNQMVLALGIEDSAKAARAEAAVTDMTNKLLNANAEKLKTATIETAQAAERGIVDIETLKKTNESLIATLDEVARIQSEGRQKRREAEAELGRLETELKDKLLGVRNEASRPY